MNMLQVGTSIQGVVAGRFLINIKCIQKDAFVKLNKAKKVLLEFGRCRHNRVKGYVPAKMHFEIIFPIGVDPSNQMIWEELT